MYRILRFILFLFPPEPIHYFSMNCLKALCSIGFIRRLISRSFTPREPGQAAKLGHIIFRNPVGLGAGFDKNAKYLRELQSLGFGFVEIGTVTPLAQDGNEKPRLFRLTKDKAMINRMGFNNDGVKAVVARLEKFRRTEKIEKGFVIGGNIGKNKQTPNEDAWKDYAICFTELHPYVDFFVVNVSSPNTPGLRELQDKNSLKKILQHLQMINNGKAESKPIFLKIAPDLNWDQLDEVMSLANEIKLDGIVATNTTISREGLKTPKEKLEQIGAGGLSGIPLKSRSTEVLKYIFSRSEQRMTLVASGGIFSISDAREKFSAGASLVEVWTGFIYTGPSIVKKICKK
jgi:dihydroorotate dehydrogenase